MGLSRTQILLLILALIGLGILVEQTTITAAIAESLRRLDDGCQSRCAAAHECCVRSATRNRTTIPATRCATSRTVITQGYGVGSHAPASVWGGVDLAIDGDGDGKADPQGTWHAPVYATHDGIARVRPDTWPGGNYLAIENNRYKTAYAHLDSYAVIDGQPVVRGQLIGYVGSTGMSSGPHLHYEVWEQGVNRNPLDFGVLRVE
jgi:Membrane proteins related to metalloendopeptidases